MQHAQPHVAQTDDRDAVGELDRRASLGIDQAGQGLAEGVLLGDLVGYRQAGLNLTDEELLDLVRELGEVLAPRLALPQGPGRRRRIFTTVLIPGE